jgi:hypothetical protein
VVIVNGRLHFVSSGLLPGLGLFFLALLPGRDAGAQNANAAQSAIEQNRLFQTSPGLREQPAYEGYETEVAPVTPGDPDLGLQQILKRKETYQPFRVSGSVEGYFTDNVALVKNGTQDDAYLVGTVGAAWVPKINDSFYGEVSATQQFFRYDEFDALDFDSLNLGAGLTHYWPQLANIATTVRYNYNRLTDADEGKEFFRNHQASAGVSKTFAHTRNLFTFIDGSAVLSFSDPYASQRWEYALKGGIFGRITRAWDAQASYRIALYDYFSEGRDDLNQSLNLQTSYHFTPWARVGATTTFSFNNSTQPVFDYAAINTGGGVYLNLKF